MSFFNRTACAVFALCTLGVLWAPAETVLFPPGQIALGRAGQTQQLLLLDNRDGASFADKTGNATWASSAPAIATVSADGTVTAVANGEATITGMVDAKPLTTMVTVSGADQPFTYNFRNHIQPLLFKAGCNTGPCHGAQSGKNGFHLSLRGFDDVWDYNALTRQANARRVSLARPEESLLLLKPTMAVPHEGGERFGVDSEAYHIVLAWIRAGAPAPTTTDPVVDAIEVFPRAMTLAPGSTQRMVVRAHYDNGSVEDVTHWAKYSATEEAVAQVDDLGKVSILAPGSGAITVWYASKLASIEITVPRTTPIPPAIYADAPRHNFVDELVLKKLQAMQIGVAPQADDTTFVRRIYLDTLGILPKPDEVTTFRDDHSADKRARLIDALLERPEFVDYWTYRWSDLLLVGSNTLKVGEEINAFYRFIRASVAENKGWDQFVREIITAKGNTLENGAGAFYLMHKEISDLTETTSQAFLGMSITCARCHNHPLEKWTQNDYYGMANLLSRVKLKNGRVPNSTEVQPADFGNVVHPRLGVPMPPKPLDAPAMTLDDPGDRREYLARWLTAPENPYFARAIVNRVWKNFMGRGLVEAEDDLRLTNPASNAELLDALAADLATHNFDLKHLMRTILRSAAYQRASTSADPATPDDRFYSQYIIKRLPAEVILDAYSQVTGAYTMFSGYPEGTRALQLRDVSATTYFLTAFGRPSRKQTCACERTADATIAQTLHLANGTTLNDKLKGGRSIIKTWVEAGISDQDVVYRLFTGALSRFPTDAELAESAAAIAVTDNDPAQRREAIEDLAWAILSSKAFLFNH